MTPDMAFECLLVSQDPVLFLAMDRVLRDLSIHTNLCQDTARAGHYLAEGSTDLLVVDLDSEYASELVHQVFESRMHQKPTVLAVSAGDCVLPGVHVILQKPVTPESGTKSVKTAYVRMLRDYRRHTRFALMTPVLASDENGRALSVIVTNIGEGGVGLTCKEKLTIGSIVSFRMLLPDLGTDLRIQARVLWSRGEYGAAGCEFMRLAPGDLFVLREWLESKYRFKRPVVLV
jgi:hypothetical protein